MHESGPRPIRLFDSFGILPRVIRFFLLEKGLDVPRYEVDLLLGENRDPEYLKLNPSGQTPALELSDGTILCEGPVICEYLEELYPDPPLIGMTGKERAITRMWWRRVELNICQPMILGFYYGEGLETYRTRMRCIPEAADGMKERARDGIRWLDGLLRGEWVAGPSFTVADIHLYSFVQEMSEKGQQVPDECAAVKKWMDRVAARPAAEMSLWRWKPAAEMPAPERPRISS
ncbi:glutathione S-transferase family protein [Sphingomonas hankyongi]|uniref:Glutathione S-transferase family protein n=1 Tax=Sphingomonas hankyongi TaxID=2908209 RepID=A0ABT0S1W3_9SPHN|nr:glutathione S-transferase family protein [Sphingomonas hankyongi]MCL6729832.1 glutathione S-transferase family protein [Sphingomonas hankyongi]